MTNTWLNHASDKLIDDVFFDLVDLSERGLFSDLDEPGTFIVGDTLLRMASPSDIELIFTVQYDERDDIVQHLTLYARGTSPFIDAGLFNLDELIRRTPKPRRGNTGAVQAHAHSMRFKSAMTDAGRLFQRPRR